MNFKKTVILMLLLSCLLLHARDVNTEIFQRIAEHVPEGKVLTITDFRGNHATEFTRGLISYLRTHKRVDFVDYDIHRMVLGENLRYSEPVFDDRFTESIPRLTAPDVGIIGSANLQRSNFLFKQREHLDFELNLVELSTGLIIANINDRIQVRYNPPILLLVILIALILGVARWIIYLKNGYKVMFIMSITLFLIAVVIVWYVL